MTNQEFENLKAYFKILTDSMDERNMDCSCPKNEIDKGYNLAVWHMKQEISHILCDLEKQIWPKIKEEFI